MSLFENMTTLSKQHAENSGSYTFGPKYKNGDKCVIVARIHGHYFDIGMEVTIIGVMGDYGDPCPYKARFGESIWFVGDDEIKLLAEQEPTPTVSLYNLLDHSDDDLDFLLDCADRREKELRPMKLAMNESYMKAVSWINIIEGALREKRDRDSEAWAEKTAKEIKETDNQFQAQQDSGGTL